MLRTERESPLLIELTPTHYCRGVCLASDETKPGDVLGLIKNSERIWVWAHVGLSIQAFEPLIDQSHGSPEEIKIKV